MVVYAYGFPCDARKAEDGWIVVECPALPGCVSQGKDEQEALANIKEAIAAWLWAEDQKANFRRPQSASNRKFSSRSNGIYGGLQVEPAPGGPACQHFRQGCSEGLSKSGMANNRSGRKPSVMSKPGLRVNLSDPPAQRAIRRHSSRPHPQCRNDRRGISGPAQPQRRPMDFSFACHTLWDLVSQSGRALTFPCSRSAAFPHFIELLNSHRPIRKDRPNIQFPAHRLDHAAQRAQIYVRAVIPSPVGVCVRTPLSFKTISCSRGA